MTAWPDLEAYKAWARIAPGDIVDDANIQASLDAATQAVLARCRRALIGPQPLGTTVDGPPSTVTPAIFPVPETCPPDVAEAVLLWTRRLAVRRDSPAGVIGVADTGQVLVPGRDADIVRLLAPWRDVVAG